MSNWFTENKELVGALGAGLGGILGLKAGKGDTQGSAGYQGGIPEYQYGRTLKDDAFANTYQQEVPATEWYTTPGGMLGQRNIPGETTSVTTPRRAGGMGRSYFNYPEAGSYSPVTTTDPDTGVVTENLLGGDYLDTLTAASNKARTDEEAFYQDLGQSYLDAYDANAALAGVTEGSDVITAGVVPVNESIDLSGTVIDTSDIPTATGGLASLSADPATTASVTSSSLPATSVSLTPGSTTTTTTGSASDLYNYLTGLGFGENAKSITVEDVENFTNQGVFALDDIATALGTDSPTLLGIANYTPPTALETALDNMGFAAEGGKTITAGDITSLTDAGYAAADIATALGTDVSTLLDIVNYVPPTALETALSNMDYAVEGGKTITAGDITSLTDAGYALADIATALGVTEAQLNSISSYVPPTDLQTALSGMGFAAEGGKTITAGDITSLTDAGYALADIATALGVTEGHSISSYLQTALSGMGFAAEGGKTITAGDITSLTDAGYALADIATALGVTETQLNSISNYVAPTALETSLSNMGFAAEGGKTITAGDITSLTDAGYALADIATALGVTEAQLNSISSYVAPTNLQTETLSNMGFAAEGGKTITAGDITSLTDDGYALADIATALGVTEAQLNSISNYTAPAAAATAVNELLIAAGFGGDGRAITSDDVAGWKAAVANQSVYTLSDIAAAFGMSETELLAIDTSGAATGGLLENNGYYLGGSTDGMADQVPATIGGEEPARLSDGEFVVPADVVSHLGNGNSQAGSEQLYSMMDRVRKERTGTTMQGAQINPMQQLPA